MHLLVGLGNPGPEYEGHRHNVGFQVVGELARRAGAAASRTKFGAVLCEGALGGARVILCKPMEYMNVSGQAVARVAAFWKIPPDSTVVVHDELDVPFGRLKLGLGGGAGGHNGVRSLIADLATPDFVRVRFGVGRPPPGWDGADYVLSNFSSAERKELPDLVTLAADAVEVIVKDGLTAAMNRFNKRPRKPEDEA